MTKDEICALAESLAQQYNPEGLAPFPYENITKDKEDLDISIVDLPEGLSGAIIFLKEVDRFRILINKEKPKTRQNFTIAHELGHYFLHQETLREQELIADGENNVDNTAGILFRPDVAESTKLEIEANNFAASLIMPSDLIKRSWEKINDIEELAGVFHVSPTAMSIRLEKLKLI
jgi:Zn-dependent peptidase ImmA (M78 family)